MDCAEEVAILKREVGPVVGGEDHLAFDILNGKMSVRPPASGVTPDAVIRAVARAGMRADVWRDAGPKADRGGTWQDYGRTTATILSGLLGLFGFGVHVVVAGSVWTAIGSEGLGVVHDVPLGAGVLRLGSRSIAPPPSSP